jgi:hypothetical protein
MFIGLTSPGANWEKLLQFGLLDVRICPDESGLKWKKTVEIKVARQWTKS